MCRLNHSSKQKLRKLCCFRPRNHRVLHNEDSNSPSVTTQEVFGANERSSGVIGRITRRQNQYVDCSYDPVSYALNFENDDDKADEFLLRGFSARLPASPLRPGKDVKGIVVYS